MSPRRCRRAAPTTSLASYEDGLARRRHRPRPLAACATPSRCGRSSARSLGIAAGGLDMWTQHARLLAVRHAAPRQAGRRHAQARRRVPADRLSQARRQAHLRPAVVGVPVQHQSRGRPAAASAGRATWRCRSRPSTTSMPGRRRAIARPASTSGSRRAASRASSSTRRTASTAKPATSRTPTATSPGCRPRAAAGRNTPNM